MAKMMTAQLPISIAEAEQLEKEILGGAWGKDGDRFVSTKMLAEKRKISLVTAHKVLGALCEKKLIRLAGKKYVLSYAEVLKEGQTRIIGLLISSITDERLAMLAHNIEVCARDCGYRVIVAESSCDAGREADIIDMFKNIRVSGIISCAEPQSSETAYEDLKIPYIMCNACDNAETVFAELIEEIGI